MDYFQGVVTEYLRADRAMFVNTECLIQLEVGDVPSKGRHWYCDAVALSLRENIAYLCEVTYSKSMASLVGRLRAWNEHWPALCEALIRDCCIPRSWTIQPWLFIPQERHPSLREKLAPFIVSGERLDHMPVPKVTYLESVAPWKYPSWDRKTAALENES